MAKVGLITSWNERCGIAEYAKNLTHNCPNTQFKIYDVRSGYQILYALGDAQIVLLNYEAGLFAGIGEDFIAQLRSRGLRVVLIWHNSHSGDNRGPWTNLFDRVVVHEETTDGFRYIPMGIPEETRLHSDGYLPKLVGSFGFPFPWKGFDPVCRACEMLGCQARIIAPESRHWDTHQVGNYLKGLCSKLNYVTDYMDQSSVVRRLAECHATVFAYSGGNSGVSAACRLGLATGRPIVLTRCRQFRDLFPYEDEIFFIDDASPEKIAEALQEALNPYNKKMPGRVLKDMAWSKVGRMYEELFKELV